MKKQSHAQPTLGTLDSSWEENPAIQWLIKNKSTLAYTLLAICAALILIWRLNSSNTSKAEKDYLNAENDFVQLMQASPDDKAAFQQLEEILQRRSELHAKYDGLVAQVLLDRNELKEAQPFADRAIARTTSENSPFYTDYAQTTLLIAAQNYSEALKRATALHQQLLNQPETQTPKFGDTLFAFNVLRIAMLQQQLGLKDEELKTWQEWQSLTANSKGFAAQFDHFQLGKVNLTNYIEARIKELKQ